MQPTNNARLKVLRLLAFSLLASVATVAAPSAAAIEINITLDTNTSENPDWDSQGTRLLSTFNAAAQIWENLLPGDGILNVDVEWDDDIDGLGLYTPYVLADPTIEINPDYSWFYDSSPHDHSGFNFAAQDRTDDVYWGGQWLYRDLPPDQQSAWFNSSPPGALEVGYRGFSQSLYDADTYDLLSTVVHELGHALGVNSSGGPFEADPAWVNGGTAGFNRDGGHLAGKTTLMCAECGLSGVRRLPSAVDVMAVADQWNHTTIDLARKEYNSGTGSWDTGMRWIGGSAPDADDDVFIRMPGSSPTVFLASTAAARDVFVGTGDRLLTDAYSLNARSITIDGVGTRVDVSAGGVLDTTGDVVVRNYGTLNMNGGRVESSSLSIDSNGQIAGASGQGTVIVGQRLTNDGTIRPTSGSIAFLTSNTGPVWDLDGRSENGIVSAASGSLSFVGALTDSFNGTMEVGAGHTLGIYGSVALASGATLRLDGGSSSSGEARYIGGSSGFLSVTQNAAVHASGVARISSAFALGSGSVTAAADADLTFDDDATIAGGTVNVAPGADVHFNSLAHISGISRLLTTGTGSIEFNGDTRLAGGTISVTGDIRQNGTATVSSATIINGSGFWDLDGNVGDTVWNISDDLTLNVPRIEAGTGSQSFDGTLKISGRFTNLSVNTTTGWDMDGNLELIDSADVQSQARMSVTGQVEVSGGSSSIGGPVAFQSGSTVAVSGTAVLRLNGETHFEGGSFRGNSIQQNGVAFVDANTTIGTNLTVVPAPGATLIPLWVELYDWDGSGGDVVTHISSGSRWTINAERIDNDPANDGYDGTVNIDGGTLIVNTGDRVQTSVQVGSSPAIVVAAPWRMDGTMNLTEVDGNQAAVATHYGSPMQIYGTVNASSGRATLALPVSLHTAGRIHVADGATLLTPLIASGGLVDVDHGGLLRLNNSELGSTSTMLIDGTAELLDATIFHGGPIRGDGVLHQRGDADFQATTQLEVAAEFDGGGTNQIAAGRELQFAADGRILPGASFNGGGAIRNLEDSLLVLAHEADVDVPLHNEGELRLGNSPGHVAVAEYFQSSSGSLEIELGGLLAGDDYDSLSVDGTASLAGNLAISLIDGFMPTARDSFEFLSAASILGSFENIVDGRLSTAGSEGSFQVSIDAGSNQVRLMDFVQFSLDADFDQDGDVDGDDFLIWQTGFGTSSGATRSIGDADGDNDVDGDDFLVWQSQLGNTTAGSGNIRAVPEATSAWLILSAILLGILPSRRVVPSDK